MARKNGSDSGWYGYDFLGRRVWRTVFGTSTVQTHYIFDSQGHLLAEHDGATGNVIREYVWLDDVPIAVIDSSSGTAQTYFVHTGQIEEPLVMTDATKATVWDAYVEPYGQAQAFGTPSAGLDIRLPGQWLEPESGNLHQNWNRTYDPALGIYIQSDPLGIEVGQNIYTYADGDPINAIDPEGLERVVLFNPLSDGLYYVGVGRERDIAGVCLVYGHMSSRGVEMRIDGKKVFVTSPTDINRELMRRGCKPKQPVYFLGCRAGEGDDSIAERYSRQYGVRTVGTTRQTWWSIRGFDGAYGRQNPTPKKPGYSNKNTNDPGQWRVFGP